MRIRIICLAIVTLLLAGFAAAQNPAAQVLSVILEDVIGTAVPCPDGDVYADGTTQACAFVVTTPTLLRAVLDSNSYVLTSFVPIQQWERENNGSIYSRAYVSLVEARRAYVFTVGSFNEDMTILIVTSGTY